MTRAQIDKLQTYKLFSGDTELYLAKNDVLELLEPTPASECKLEDYISRDDVWDVMQELWGTSGELIDRLMSLPSVTPQPKHGIWQQTNKNEVNVIPEYKCSECGAEYKGFGFDFDYCPRCGCAMEVDE